MVRETAWREAREASARDVHPNSHTEPVVPPPPHHRAPDTVTHVRPGEARPAVVPDDHILVQLPQGPAWLSPADAGACQAELDRRAQKEALREEREEERRQYYRLIGKRYPD